jgi:dTDP-4-dehydrorhamnose reductase
MKTVLLTGCAGLLGKYLQKTAPENIRLISTYKTYAPSPSAYMDILEQMIVDAVFSIYKPDCVIHCAANGDVDFAEKNPSESRRINVQGTKNIINACKDFESKLIHISTNAVFDGGTPPYSEDSTCNPVNEYGRIKLEAESAVTTSGIDWNIIRPILLYGWPYINGRQNFVTKTLMSIVANDDVEAVDDTVTQPTYAYDCAKSIWRIFSLDKSKEIYHIGGMDSCSLFDLAIKTAEVFGHNKELIKPVKSSHFPSIAKRPVNTTFNTDKAKSIGIACRGVSDGLKAMMEEVE